MRIFNTSSRLGQYHSLTQVLTQYQYQFQYQKCSIPIPKISSIEFPALKRLESFQRSCFSWIFERKQSYLEHLRRSKFLPICYHLEYITFSFLCQLLDDKYIFNFTPHLVFQVPERQLRASTTNIFRYLNPKRYENVSFRSCCLHGKLFVQK